MLDDFREWLSDNLRYILLGLAALLLIVICFCVFRLVVGGSKKDDSSSGKPAAVQSEQKDEPQAGTEAQKTEDTVPAATAEAGNLVKDDSAVLTIVKQYYSALAEKNTDALASIVSTWNDDVKDSILGKNVTESYSNISVYSKKGLTDGSYVVYAYYDGKIADIDTLVPSLALLYLEKDPSGKLVVVIDHDKDKAVTDYITKVSSDADVQELVSTVKKQYDTALEQDQKLQNYIKAIDGQASTEPATEAEPEPQLMKAAYDVNVRETGSTNAAILTVLSTGAEVTVLSEADADGWCKIRYENDQIGTVEGYVKLEFLTPADTATAA